MEERNREPTQRTPTGSGGGDSITRILVVEHDRDAAERLGQPLGRAGLQVVLADSVARARPILFDEGEVGLALVGVRLPNGDARELCREIRASDGPPVILVGDRANEQVLIAGLHLGADDYLVEPFRTAELLARVGAVLRRAAAGRRHPAPPDRRQVGPLTVDPATHTATVDGEQVKLTPREYALLLALVRRQGEVVTRDELISAVWGPGWMGTSKVLDVQMSGLRRKLGGPDQPSLIHTLRSVGFRLAPPDDE